MTDSELLELAAKAAGELTPSWYGNQDYFDGVLERWNPLTDDGDALRLAVKLEMELAVPRNRKDVYAGRLLLDAFEPVGSDPYAATRRAIVRAAAEIGKEMDK